MPTGPEPGTGETQRATWDNNQRMMQAPLTNGNDTESCAVCRGKGHSRKDCPSILGSENPKWMKIGPENKLKPCSSCGGFGHWHFMHERGPRQSQTQNQPPVTQNSSQDCLAWAVGKCSGENARNNTIPIKRARQWRRIAMPGYAGNALRSGVSLITVPRLKARDLMPAGKTQ